MRTSKLCTSRLCSTPTWLLVALPLIILFCFSLSSVTSVCQKSATYDESHYIGVGYGLIKKGPARIAAINLHPRLFYILHGLPLFFMNIPENIWDEQDADIRGQKIIDLRSDDWILNSSRLMMFPLALLLGIVVFFWSKRLYGYWGGILSLTLFSFCPNIIAHSCLITPDIMLTAFFVLSCFLTWRYAEAPSRFLQVMLGLDIGLLFLSKYTALILAPVLVLSDLVFRIRFRRNSLRRLTDFSSEIRHWGLILIIAFLVVWTAYGFEIKHSSLPILNKLSIWLPAASYLDGALYQWIQSRTPHAFYLLGQHSTNGWWYYYLVVIAVKCTLGTLILAIGLLPTRLTGPTYVNNEIYLWFPCLLIFLYFSFFNTIHNGFRYLLPVYPLLLILLGRITTEFPVKRWLRFLVPFFAILTIVSSLRVWPDYLAYFNEAIGGPRKGYLWLGDSNLDWGQDLKQLGRYMKRNKISKIQLSYFGTADPAHYGILYDYLPSPNSTLLTTPPLPTGAAAPSIVAISIYQYQGIAFVDKYFYSYFWYFEPNDIIGNSIFIYNLRHLIPRR